MTEAAPGEFVFLQVPFLSELGAPTSLCPELAAPICSTGFPAGRTDARVPQQVLRKTEPRRRGAGEGGVTYLLVGPPGSAVTLPPPLHTLLSCPKESNFWFFEASGGPFPGFAALAAPARLHYDGAGLLLAHGQGCIVPSSGGLVMYF